MEYKSGLFYSICFFWKREREREKMSGKLCWIVLNLLHGPLTATSSFIFLPSIFQSLFNSTPNWRKFSSLILSRNVGDSFQSVGNQSSNSVPRFSKFVYIERIRKLLFFLQFSTTFETLTLTNPMTSFLVG